MTVMNFVSDFDLIIKRTSKQMKDYSSDGVQREKQILPMYPAPFQWQSVIKMRSTRREEKAHVMHVSLEEHWPRSR